MSGILLSFTMVGMGIMGLGVIIVLLISELED